MPPLRRKRSESGSLVTSSTTPSDQKAREEKSAPYQDPRYKTLLEIKGSFMGKYVGTDVGISDKTKLLCRTLLEKEQEVPIGTLFDDVVFDKACDMIDGRNEAKVVQDITRLLVPSAQILALRDTKLKSLIESVNEGWNNSIPLIGTRPQPDYSVGFKRDAFSEEQHKKLRPLIGDFLAGCQSYYMATYYMYFPFLTCEVKCGAQALDIADRQNAHSMTLAVRAVVELFRHVGREKEADREILAFSVSHDNRSVRIYGHFAVIDGPKTTYYRHQIHTFDFTALDGKERWTAYKFTRNLYDMWMPTHLERICSVIDQLPVVDSDILPLPLECDGLSRGPQARCSSRSSSRSASRVRGDSQSSISAGTTESSFTQPKRQKGDTSTKS